MRPGGPPVKAPDTVHHSLERLFPKPGAASGAAAPGLRCRLVPTETDNTPLRVPKLFDLRADPYERADVTSNTYYDWVLDNDFIILAASGIVTQFLETFKEFPPRQKAASFTIDQAVEKLETAITSHR